MVLLANYERKPLDPRFKVYYKVIAIKRNEVQIIP